MKKLVLNIGLLLLTLLGVFSCNIKEDMSDCPGSMILDYSAYSDLILDDIADDEQIDVFIFDPNGVCVDMRTFTYGQLREVGFEFELPISYRNYNAVVWHGLDSENYSSKRMVLGESYENFFMRLLYDTENSSYACMPDPLWASSLEPIDYCAKITRHRVYMTRLHTQIDVQVQQKMSDGSIVPLASDEVKLSLTASNNVYHTDHRISREAVEIEYTNDDELDVSLLSVTHSNDCSCVGTLRLTPDMECSLEMEKVNGTQILIGGNDHLDIIDYMLATKGDSELSDQEFLDLNKVWDIDLVVEANDLGYVALSLTINGWVVWFSSSELS